MVRRVHLGSFGSFGGVAGCVGFILARTGGRRVLSGLLGSFGRALGVSFMHVQAVIGFIWVRLVYSGAPSVLLGSFGFLGSIDMRPGRSLGWLGSFGRALVFVGVDLVHSDASSAWSVSFCFVVCSFVYYGSLG